MDPFNFINAGRYKKVLHMADTHGVLARHRVSVKDVMNLCGGVPISDRFELVLWIRSVSNNTVEMIIRNRHYTVVRKIDFNLKIIVNKLMHIHDQGRGIGLTLFLNQVKQAKKQGFEKLTVYAAGSPGQQNWDGYYFWARLGYQMSDASDKAEAEKIIQRFRPGVGFSEMMLSDAGYAFWKNNGFDWRGEFLLEGGSPSLIHLQRYLEMKNIHFHL